MNLFYKESKSFFLLPIKSEKDFFFFGGGGGGGGGVAGGGGEERDGVGGWG